MDRGQALRALIRFGERLDRTSIRGIPLEEETTHYLVEFVRARLDYDPDQPRAENGQWGEGSGQGRSSNQRRLTGPEQFAVSDYKNTGYAHINESLRKETPVSESVRRQIDTLDRLINESTLDESAVLFRVLDGKRVGDRYLKPGVVVTDKGFLSTSTSEHAAMRAVKDALGTVKTPTVIEIRAPKGSRALDMEGTRVGPSLVHGMGDEGEMLLPRGSSLRIISADRATRRVVAELVEPVR